MTKQLQAAAAMLLILASGSPSLPAQTAKATATPHKRTAKKTESTVEQEIRDLREQLRLQQAQINSLLQLNADKDARLASATADAQSANTAAATATAQTQAAAATVQANTAAVTALSSTVDDLRTSSSGLAQTLIETKKDLTAAVESPTVLHYKGMTITPVAFFALETVFRSRSLDSDINTPFNATSYPGAAQSHTSELNFSGRQSRLGGLFEGNTGPFKLSGYFETDFLSAGVTSNDNQSNSYTLRQRQIWGQAATQRGFTFTGGQMWSLVTETKKSTDNRTENLPMTVDPQYHVGFSWARQPSLRFQQKIGGLTAAFSLEEAQTIYAATNANANFFIGGGGTGGGLYNATANYSNDIAPDVIVKFAYDTPHFGHYEIGGLARFFRDRYYPNQTLATPSATGGLNDTKVGGGFFANARFPVTRYADIGLHTLGGSGVGRYGTSSLPDVTVHPNGTLAPIKAYQGLVSVELHPTKKLDVFGYAGGEYAQRTVYLSTLGSSAGKLIGYAPISASNAGCNTETLPTSTGNGLAGAAPYNPGTPANCLGATRAVLAGTAGFTYRIYNSPRFGRLQYQGVYTYLKREAWTGIGGAPNATNNMVFTGMRYYIP